MRTVEKPIIYVCVAFLLHQHINLLYDKDACIVKTVFSAFIAKTCLDVTVP